MMVIMVVLITDIIVMVIITLMALLTITGIINDVIKVIIEYGIMVDITLIGVGCAAGKASK